MGQPNEGAYTITIDDDPIVAKTIAAATGLQSLAYGTAAAFQAHTETRAPIAVFVDIHLGLEENGIDLIPSIRAQWPYCPVIVVTTEPGGDAVGQALAAGAHDFVRKPIDRQELTARLRARSIELSEKSSRDMLRLGDLSINLSINAVTGPNGTEHLSHSDTRLLQYLAQANGVLVSRAELKRKLWGNVTVSDNALDKKLHDVRKALREVGSQIKLTSSYRQGFSLIVPAGASQVA